MTRQLSRQTLSQILQAENIDRLSLADLVRLVETEEGVFDFRPEGICHIDPRNGDRIVYNSARVRRPHDNRPPNQRSTQQTNQQSNQQTNQCIICQGQTTGVIDVADLSEGFTFINVNLFPSLYPGGPLEPSPQNDLGPAGIPVHGFHFLQWTSAQHNKDWHNMPPSDRVVVMQRLAALEKKLLTEQAAASVLIIKNYGRLVGGSLEHGHQQIGFSSVMPRRMRDNQRFEQERGETFSAYLLRENPPELVIKDYGPAVLLVPYFMRRPYDMMLLVKDVSRRYLYERVHSHFYAKKM